VSHFTKTTIGKPAQWLIEAAASTGLDFTGLTHEITNYFKNHVIKRHGKGLLAITEKDFEKIPVIVEAPDMAIIGAIREGLLFNAYVKRIDNETYLVDPYELLYAAEMPKKPGKTGLIKRRAKSLAACSLSAVISFLRFHAAQDMNALICIPASPDR